MSKNFKRFALILLILPLCTFSEETVIYNGYYTGPDNTLYSLSSKMKEKKTTSGRTASLSDTWRRIAFGIQFPLGPMPRPDTSIATVDEYDYEFEGMPEFDLKISLTPNLELEFELPFLRTINGATRRGENKPFIFRGYNLLLNYTTISSKSKWGAKLGGGGGYMQFYRYPEPLDTTMHIRGAIVIDAGLHRILGKALMFNVFANTGLIFTHPVGWYGLQVGAGIMVYLDWEYYFDK